MPTPSEGTGKPEKHPHLEASPYEHHFDTYTLVQDLANRGKFTEDQAVTLMKAIRLMLAINLDIAKEGLVTALVGQRPFEMGYKAPSVMLDLIAGKTVADPVFTGLDECTKDTADTCIQK